MEAVLSISARLGPGGAAWCGGAEVLCIWGLALETTPGYSQVAEHFEGYISVEVVTNR